MVYRAIGLMSGSSLDGLDIAYVEFLEEGGKWSYEILQADCYPYTDEWVTRLREAVHLSARDYQLLHAAYGHYTGSMVNQFIEEHQLQYKVALVASHGHTTFHIPGSKMTAQLGDGAAIAASTQLPVVSDLRSLDVAFGGQGAPIVPIGEKMLMDDYQYFLNIGGIANISFNGGPSSGPSSGSGLVAFDVCPANRVLNLLAGEMGKTYDDGGLLAAAGSVNTVLLDRLNALDYYQLPYPKSLANDFGTDRVFPLIKESGCTVNDGLRTYIEHIVIQIRSSIADSLLRSGYGTPDSRLQTPDSRLLATGGGALNSFLVQRLTEQLKELGVDVVVPDKKLVNFKEALVMAFIGVLRWRQEYNVLASVTGAERDSIGGALWNGQEA